MKSNVSYEDFINGFEKMREIPISKISSVLGNLKAYEGLFNMLNFIKNVENNGVYSLDVVKENYDYFDIEILDFYEGLKEYTFTEEMIDWLVNIDFFSFKKIFSRSVIGNMDSVSCWENSNEKISTFSTLVSKTIKENEPFKYMCCINSLSSVLEKEYHLKHLDLIDQTIRHYIENPEGENCFLAYFSIFNDEEFDKYFKDEYIDILSKASYLSYVSCLNWNVKNKNIGNKLSPKVLRSDCFLQAFTSFSLGEQLSIISLLEEQECEKEIISMLRDNLKEACENDHFINKYFKMDVEKFMRISFEILNSSYCSSNLYSEKEKELISFLKQLDSSNNNIDNEQAFFSRACYDDLIELYEHAVNYSKDDIVSGLYNVSDLPNFINYLDSDQNYSILVNNNELGNSSFEPYNGQILNNFCVITPNNFGNQVSMLYGYYKDISKDKIIGVFPYPIDLSDISQYKRDIGVGPVSGRKNCLWINLDLFNKITYENSVAGSIVLKTKNVNGTTIQPDCLISIGDKITKREIQEASRRNLKILHLKKRENTNFWGRKTVSHHYG